MSFDGDEFDANSSDLKNTLKIFTDARDAIDLSIALRPRENGGSRDELDDDNKLSLRLGLFILSDSVCRAVLNAISEHPQITFTKLWTLEHYEKGPGDKFAKSVSQSWYSCWFWPQTTCQKIGLTGIYQGMKWHVASNFVSNILDYGLASYPSISDKTRQRIAAACAIAPQMYCQVHI